MLWEKNEKYFYFHLIFLYVFFFGEKIARFLRNSTHFQLFSANHVLMDINFFFMLKKQETRNSTLPLDLDEDSSSLQSQDTDKRKNNEKTYAVIVHLRFPLTEI